MIKMICMLFHIKTSHKHEYKTGTGWDSDSQLLSDTSYTFPLDLIINRRQVGQVPSFTSLKGITDSTLCLNFLIIHVHAVPYGKATWPMLKSFRSYLSIFMEDLKHLSSCIYHDIFHHIIICSHQFIRPDSNSHHLNSYLWYEIVQRLNIRQLFSKMNASAWMNREIFSRL